MQNRLQTYSRSFERRIPDQRPHPPTILPFGPRNHPIRLRISPRRTHTQNRQRQSRHPFQISQHQTQKPQPILATANTIHTLRHTHLPNVNPHPIRQSHPHPKPKLDHPLRSVPQNWQPPARRGQNLAGQGRQVHHGRRRPIQTRIWPALT